MRTGKRDIAWGDEFSTLFSTAKGQFVDVKKYAVLNDTLGLMKEVIATTLDDTRTIAQTFRASTPLQTCRNVWNFCFHHIQYEKDEPNVEQVRRPSRTWKDRIHGVDCDCLTVFIGSVLTNLGIPFVIRITKYNGGEDFEHVYPVALLGNQQIIMDAVVHQFNYEVPYSEKKDITMKLQYLNGFEDDDDFGPHDENDALQGLDVPEDAEALFLFDDEELEGLDGKAKREQRKEKHAEKKEERQEKREERKENKPPLKERLKKGLNVVNKLNPATALLRAGLLASMKLNIGKVAAKLRYSYWTEEQARANQMEDGKLKQLQDVRKKLENIFYGAGGKVSNLRKAMLTGRGNRDKKVALNGLGAITHPVNDNHDLQTIIGDETFYEEFEGIKSPGIHGLGEPVSAAAALAAASGIIATIVGMIKKVGSLFKKGSPQEQQETINDNTSDKEEQTRKFSLKNLGDKLKDLPKLSPDIKPKPGPTATNDAPDDEGTDDDIPDDDNDQKPDAPTPASADSAPSVSDEHPDEPGPAILLPSVVEKSAGADAIGTGTGASANEVVKSELPTADDSKDEKDKSTKKPVVMQWVQDHPVLSAGIAVLTIGGAIMAYKAYQAAQAKKATDAKKNLSGIPARTGKAKSKAAKGGIKKVKLL